MRFLYIILIFAILQSTAWARFAMLPLKDAVESSDLIVMGTLAEVKEYTENKMDYGSGTITVEKVLYGKLPAKEKKLTLVWSNPTGLTCPRVEHKHEENKKGIWLLKLQKDEKVRADHPMRFLPLDKVDEVKKLLPKPSETVKSSPDNSSSNKKERLWGIAKVEINDDGTVTLTDIIKGKEHGMWFPGKKGGFKPTVTLKKGESCEFTDGDHAFTTIKLDKIEKGKITFTIKDKFDARSFGDGIKTSTKTITIKPYKKLE